MSAVGGKPPLTPLTSARHQDVYEGASLSLLSGVCSLGASLLADRIRLRVESDAWRPGVHLRTGGMSPADHVAATVQLDCDLRCYPRHRADLCSTEDGCAGSSGWTTILKVSFGWKAAAKRLRCLLSRRTAFPL